MPRRKRKRNMEEQWAHERAIWKKQERTWRKQDEAWARESKKIEKMFAPPKPRKRRSSRHRAGSASPRLKSHTTSQESSADLLSAISTLMFFGGIVFLLGGSSYILIGAGLIIGGPALQVIAARHASLHRIQRLYAEDTSEPQPSTQVKPAHTLSPSDFENEVAWVLEQLYPVKAKCVGGMGDGGIDIELYDVESQTRRVIVQCKRYLPNRTVPPSEIRDLDSCRRRTGVRQALLVTTGRFSEQTQNEAKSWGIDLMDGAKFEEARTAAYRKLYPPAPALPTPTDPIQDQLDERRERLGL